MRLKYPYIILKRLNYITIFIIKMSQINLNHNKINYKIIFFIFEKGKLCFLTNCVESSSSWTSFRVNCAESSLSWMSFPDKSKKARPVGRAFLPTV